MRHPLHYLSDVTLSFLSLMGCFTVALPLIPFTTSGSWKLEVITSIERGGWLAFGPALSLAWLGWAFSILYLIDYLTERLT